MKVTFSSSLRFTLLLLSVLALPLASSFARNNDDSGSYAIGLWGDLPYSTQQATVGVPNVIADMNSQNLAFTAHDGDLKNGSAECTDSVYTQGLAYFNSLRAPAIFTPGDNDWVDCDRTAGYNSLVQLDKERALFFSTPYSLGVHPFRMEVQTAKLCLNASYVQVSCLENRRWTVGRVTYATLNVQGSCNNLCGVGPDPVEWAARNAANIQWVKDTFASARARHSVAVMFISQADPAFDDTTGLADDTRNPQTLAQDDGLPDGFQDFLLALRAEVIAFKKPVAYVHGDSHYFRVDKPLLDANGVRVINFTRVETFGDHAFTGHPEWDDNDVQWLKVYVDPKSREVFSYQPQIVPANQVANPAP